MIVISLLLLLATALNSSLISFSSESQIDSFHGTTHKFTLHVCTQPQLFLTDSPSFWSSSTSSSSFSEGVWGAANTVIRGRIRIAHKAFRFTNSCCGGKISLLSDDKSGSIAYLEQFSCWRSLLGILMKSKFEKIVEIFWPLVFVFQSWGFKTLLCH